MSDVNKTLSVVCCVLTAIILLMLLYFFSSGHWSDWQKIRTTYRAGDFVQYQDKIRLHNGQPRVEGSPGAGSAYLYGNRYRPADIQVVVGNPDGDKLIDWEVRKPD